MKYLVWLQAVLRAGSNKALPILSHFGTAKAVYNARNTALRQMNILSDGEMDRAENLSIAFAENVLSLCKKNGIKIVCYYDDNYPNALRNIVNPPLVLYIKGELPDFNTEPSVCIVGPRKVTEFGKKSAYSLAARLSKSGIIVISGGAKGADTAAHVGALKVNGKTVAILPCGIMNDYLKDNARLRELIAKKGCLISEYTPNFPVTKASFRVRNRLLAALGDTTIIVEAAEKSGALITAGYACEYGRELFVIPGNPTMPEYKGSNALLRDGVHPLLDAGDIFREYISVYGDKIDIEKAYKKEKSETEPVKSKKAQKIQKNLPSGLSKTAQMLYNSLNKQKFSADDLLGFKISDDELIAAITELEMEHLIKACAGGFYEKIEL
ncbi:MAG: DNA-protecting protein DprA [Ruminococcaceae bacterium]|nr:DNA-protecting protein DprA [Oscillospiraceae bacterium]